MTPAPDYYQPGQYWRNLGSGATFRIEEVIYRYKGANRQRQPYSVMGRVIPILSSDAYRLRRIVVDGALPMSVAERPDGWAYLGTDCNRNHCAGCEAEWIGALGYLCKACR